MPTSANLTFTPLTNPRIWFASVQAFNNFMSSITVSISGANLPVPTVSTLGGVKALEISVFTPVAEVTGSVNIVADDGATTHAVPQAAAYASLVARVAALETWVQSLYAQLAAKGYTS